MKSIALVCEGPHDRRTVCALVDCLIEAEADWTQGQRDDFRQWRGFRSADGELFWRNVKSLAEEENVLVSLRDFGADLPRTNEALTARKAILLLEGSEHRPDIIVIQRDEDGDPRREPDLRLARTTTPTTPHVIIGVARPTVESWILAGFEPQDDGERSRADEMRRKLGFDPAINGHELSRLHDDESKRPKKVLAHLTNGERNREDACLKCSQLGVLEARGRMNGLTAFLNDARAIIRLVFTGRR